MDSGSSSSMLTKPFLQITNCVTLMCCSWCWFWSPAPSFQGTATTWSTEQSLSSRWQLGCLCTWVDHSTHGSLWPLQFWTGISVGVEHGVMWKTVPSGGMDNQLTKHALILPMLQCFQLCEWWVDEFTTLWLCWCWQRNLQEKVLTVTK